LWPENESRSTGSVDTSIRDRAGCLDSIGMESDFVSSADGADFSNRLDRADLIVGHHDGDQNGIGANRLPDRFRIDPAIRIDIQIGDFVTLRS